MRHLHQQVRRKCYPRAENACLVACPQAVGKRKVKGGRGEDQSFGVLGGHPGTRAEFAISTSLEPISAAERTGGLPCVDLGVGKGVAGAGAEEERQKLNEGQVKTKL